MVSRLTPLQTCQANEMGCRRVWRRKVQQVFNHSLDLCLQNLARGVPLINDELDFVKNVANVIRESSGRWALYASMFDDSREAREIPSLCQTRWCIRGKAIQNLTKNFAEVKATLMSLTTEKTLRPTTQANIRGLSKKAEKWWLSICSACVRNFSCHAT